MTEPDLAYAELLAKINYLWAFGVKRSGGFWFETNWPLCQFSHNWVRDKLPPRRVNGHYYYCINCPGSVFVPEPSE